MGSGDYSDDFKVALAAFAARTAAELAGCLSRKRLLDEEAAEGIESALVHLQEVAMRINRKGHAPMMAEIRDRLTRGDDNHG